MKCNTNKGLNKEIEEFIPYSDTKYYYFLDLKPSVMKYCREWIWSGEMNRRMKR